MNCSEDKDKCIDNETIARFAKAMGHPTRIEILRFWLHWIAATSVIYTRSYLFPKRPYLSI